MRRMLLLLAVAAMMLALSAGTALAQIVDIPPPGEEIPGKQNAPDDNPDNMPDTLPSPEQARNCYGESQFEGFAGPGTVFPGSAARPAKFDIDAEGPRQEQDFFSGPAHKELLLAEDLQDPTDTTPGGGNNISDFQQQAREGFAACPPPPEGT